MPIRSRLSVITAPVTPAPRPGTPAQAAWFAAHANVLFAVLSSGGVAEACYRFWSEHGTAICRIAVPGGSPFVDETAAQAVFERAAVTWIASLGTLLASSEDVAWFARRPEAQIRIRPAEPAEIAGRPRGVWVTLMFREASSPYGLARLCLDERTLGREDRSQAGLMALLCTRASALAAGEVITSATSYLPPPPERSAVRHRASGARAMPLHAGRKDVQQARAAIRLLTGRAEPKPRVTLSEPILRRSVQRAVQVQQVERREVSTSPPSLEAVPTAVAPPPAIASARISPEQCRAARGWLGWSQRDLSARSLLSVGTITGFENGHRALVRNNATALAQVFQDAGIALVFDGEARPTGISAR